MKRIILLSGICALCIQSILAQEKMFVHRSDKITQGVLLSVLDSMTFVNEAVLLHLHDQDAPTYSMTEIDSLSFGDNSLQIKILYSDTGIEIVNPLAFEGVSISVDDGNVIITSTISEEVEYILTGTISNGMFKIYSDKKFILTLNGENITNADGPAINIQSGKKVTVNLTEGTINTLTDGKKYADSGSEDMKGCFFSEGQLIFNGEGALYVQGNKKHGICSDDYLLVNSGNITITGAASDGIHANDYIRIDGGSVTVTSDSDGLDGDEGYIEINGGKVQITSTSDDVKGIKCDGTFTMNGGEIHMSVSGNQSKGIKTKNDLRINDGTIHIQTTGSVAVVDNDPSYCTGIKCDQTVYIAGGNIIITSTGTAGKGISTDGDLVISGGDVQITTSGNGGTYTNTNSILDSYSATCMKSNGNIHITNGTVTMKSTGSAGKGISADGEIVFGAVNAEGPVVDATTTGAKFLVSGHGENADYANPKAIKCIGDLTSHSGTFTIRCTQDGGEGMESKDVLTINGGIYDIETYDDAINAANQVVINGGYIYCYSSGNDGIDSNGTLTVTGGIVIASGTNSPEEGFDCDRNTFSITGGVLIGTGGSSSTPTSSACSQRSVLYSASSATSGNLINIQDANGTNVFTYKLPRSYQTMTLLFSSADLKANTNYTIYTGGSISGGEDFHGYYTGAVYTPGTKTTTFTTSSMVTTIGSSGGGGGRPGH